MFVIIAFIFVRLFILRSFFTKNKCDLFHVCTSCVPRLDVCVSCIYLSQDELRILFKIPHWIRNFDEVQRTRWTKIRYALCYVFWEIMFKQNSKVNWWIKLHSKLPHKINNFWEISHSKYPIFTCGGLVLFIPISSNKIWKI